MRLSSSLSSRVSSVQSLPLVEKAKPKEVRGSYQHPRSQDTSLTGQADGAAGAPQPQCGPSAGRMGGTAWCGLEHHGALPSCLSLSATEGISRKEGAWWSMGRATLGCLGTFTFLKNSNSSRSWFKKKKRERNLGKGLKTFYAKFSLTFQKFTTNLQVSQTSVYYQKELTVCTPHVTAR